MGLGCFLSHSQHTVPFKDSKGFPGDSDAIIWPPYIPVSVEPPSSFGHFNYRSEEGVTLTFAQVKRN